VRERRPLRDLAVESRVRAKFTVDHTLRDSSEVQVSSVAGGIVHLRGVPGGPDTELAALAAARVRGVTGVEVHDKVSSVDAHPV
jgi:osmotically-inducible protein OsmY